MDNYKLVFRKKRMWGTLESSGSIYDLKDARMGEGGVREYCDVLFSTIKAKRF
jgi:hypothetical protein